MLYADIPLLFTNFKVGMLLFKKVVDNMFSYPLSFILLFFSPLSFFFLFSFSLLLFDWLRYYKQFGNILGKSFKTLKTSRNFISETEIIRELRKYDMDL